MSEVEVSKEIIKSIDEVVCPHCKCSMDMAVVNSGSDEMSCENCEESFGYDCEIEKVKYWVRKLGDAGKENVESFNCVKCPHCGAQNNSFYCTSDCYPEECRGDCDHEQKCVMCKQIFLYSYHIMKTRFSSYI